MVSQDASRGWWLRVDKSLKMFGGHRLKLDNSLYKFAGEGVTVGVVALHIDDFLVVGDNQFMKEIIRWVSEQFVVGKVERSLFLYVGWEIM